MKLQAFRTFRAAFTPVLVLGLIFTPISDSIFRVFAQTQDTCEKILAEAQDKYQEGLLQDAINLVNRCLSLQSISDDHREQAFKLLGKAYHAQGLLERAKENLKKLLELIPNWLPDPMVDTPSFQRLAEQVISEIQQQQEEQQQEEQQQEEAPPPTSQQPTQPVKKGGRKALLFIGGGGAVVAGLIIALAGGGGGGGGGDNGGNGPPLPQRLPGPPALPPDR